MVISCVQDERFVSYVIAHIGKSISVSFDINGVRDSNPKIMILYMKTSIFRYERTSVNCLGLKVKDTILIT